MTGAPGLTWVLDVTSISVQNLDLLTRQAELWGCEVSLTGGSAEVRGDRSSQIAVSAVLSGVVPRAREAVTGAILHLPVVGEA